MNKKNIKNIQIALISPLTVIIFLVFFIAKIFNKVDWSWWWIFSPLWIPSAIILTVFIILGIVYLSILSISNRTKIWK